MSLGSGPAHVSDSEQQFQVQSGGMEPPPPAGSRQQAAMFTHRGWRQIEYVTAAATGIPSD